MKEKFEINDFIEEFIKDNIHFTCEKTYVNSIQVDLADSRDVMTILQCFDSIMVYINKKYIDTYVKSLDHENNPIWIIARKI